VGCIGYGVENPVIDLGVKKRAVLKDKPFSKTFELGQLNNNLHMETTGSFAESIDKWLGLPYHMLD